MIRHLPPALDAHMAGMPAMCVNGKFKPSLAAAQQVPGTLWLMKYISVERGALVADIFTSFAL